MGRIEPARPPQTARAPEWMQELTDDARDWCRGRMWIPRAILLAYLVYADFRFLRDPFSSTMFSGITLAFHEIGHLLFAFAGHFIGSLMGSGMQLLVPIIVVALFFRQRDYFGMSVGGFWLSFSMFELANYVGDARSMDLPLVGFSDDPEHDWHYLLGATHLLPLDHVFAFLLRAAATLIGIASLVFAAWLLREMARPVQRAAVTPRYAAPPPMPGVVADPTKPSAAASRWDDLTRE